MNLKILNCPEESFKPFVERSIQFYAKELITNARIRNNCFTTVRFDSKITEYGFCSIEDYNSRKQPREFLIEVHPGLGARGILATLAHEMVHIKQYIDGETNEQLSTWRGKKINSDEVEYWSHPWEIDAYGREIGLLTKYVTSEHLWEVFSEFQNPTAPLIPKPIKWKK